MKRPSFIWAAIGFAVACVQLGPVSPATAESLLVPADSPAKSLFNPARHMRVSEVKPGQKGYVRTVVSGTKIDQYDVEVVSVVHNQFGPSRDVVLIRCKGDFMEHVGTVAGMSGSPVYLYDDSGKARMIGAYAYGWELGKDPLAGVQPIEYMTGLVPTPMAAGSNTAGHDGGNGSTGSSGASPQSVKPIRWSLAEAGLVPAFDTLARQPIALPGHPLDTKLTLERSDGNRPSLRPLAVPLAASGASPATINLLNQYVGPLGFTPMAVAGSGGGDDETDKAAIEPGSVLVANLLTGDMQLNGLGTCTDVIDGRVLAFGHPMFADGSASIPFSGGSVNVIVATLNQSFKMGAAGPIQGVLDRDTEVGIAGTIGSKARTFPVSVHVKSAQGIDRTYHFRSAMHVQYSPLLPALAAFNCISSPGELPEENTVTYTANLHYNNGRDIKMGGRITSDSSTVVDFLREMMLPTQIAMTNPFERVEPTAVDVDMTVKAGIDEMALVSARAAQLKYGPGDEVKIHLDFRRYHGEEEHRTVSFKLPDDLEDGPYTIQVLDAQNNLRADAEANPQRFVIENTDELFTALQSILNTKSDTMYLRLMRQPEGMAVGHAAMMKMPASRRLVFTKMARPDVTPVAEAVIVEIPFDSVLSAAGEAAFVVKKQ